MFDTSDHREVQPTLAALRRRDVRTWSLSRVVAVVVAGVMLMSVRCTNGAAVPGRMAPAAQSAQTADASVRLNQGTVTGLKVFPESSRTAVYSFLGIPYAQPPIGTLRFAPPKPHGGWNRTLYARNYQAICPQPEQNMYEESSSGYPFQSRMSENCLFLNIWTPENCLRFGRCSVLAIITGEEQAFDWSRNRPSGLDLAAEGIVVVTIQSRTNIFGWLTTGSAAAPGNLGLRDQQLALRWVQVNVGKFGGTADRVTLLGHGTSGAANAMLHWTTRTARSAHFGQLILMSGTVHSPWSFQVTRNAASTSLSVIRNLACESPQPAAMLDCVRQKSIVDLLRAFENVHQNGNYTRLLGAEVDRYLPDAERWLLRDPRKVIEAGAAERMPMMVGLCSNEGAFVREQWLDLARESYAALWSFVQKTLIPNALHHYGFRGPVAAGESVRETINWRFFEQVPKTVPSLLAAMQRFQSEVRFERPFFEMLEQLSKDGVQSTLVQARALVAANDTGIMEHRSVQYVDDIDDGSDANSDTGANRITTNEQPSSSLFVYSFQQPGTIDLRGRPNYFGGAAHTADLLFLMGPSLYQQIGRRKLTVTEEKLCKRMRQTFADFVKTGNPTPGRLFDAWHPYSAAHRYVQVLGQPTTMVASDEASTVEQVLQQNRAQIAEMLSDDQEVTVSSADLSINPYAIGRRKIDADRQAKSYMPGEPTDSSYTLHIERVHAFWADRLPRLYKQQEQMLLQQRDDAGPDNEPQANGGGAELAAKFRHAFFSMLALVCVLLAMLGVCVYMLRKGHRHIDTSYL